MRAFFPSAYLISVPLLAQEVLRASRGLRDAAGVSPYLDSECPGSMHEEVKFGSKVK